MRDYDPRYREISATTSGLGAPNREILDPSLNLLTQDNTLHLDVPCFPLSDAAADHPSGSTGPRKIERNDFRRT